MRNESWSDEGFGLLGVFVVLIELLLEFGSVGELLPVVFVHLLPNIPKPIPQRFLEGIRVDVESLVVETEVSKFEQILHLLHLLLDGGLLLLDLFPQLLPLRQVHQVHNHIGEVVRQVALSQSLDNLTENLV